MQSFKSYQGQASPYDQHALCTYFLCAALADAAFSFFSATRLAMRALQICECPAFKQ